MNRDKILEATQWTAAVSLLIAGAATLLIRWNDPEIMFHTLRLLLLWTMMGAAPAVAILVVGPLLVSDHDID